MKRLALVVGFLGCCACARADILAAGTWFQRGDGAPLAMIVREEAGGWMLTYKLRLPDGKLDDKSVMTVRTKADGKEVPVLLDGQPTGQTMAIRKLDANHAFAVIRFQGKDVGTSKSELSPDGKVLKVENENTSSTGGPPVGKQIVYWDRK